MAWFHESGSTLVFVRKLVWLIWPFEIVNGWAYALDLVSAQSFHDGKG
jgi:hypothetical protein